MKDRNEGGFWRDMLSGSSALYQRPVIEMALASFYERNGQLDKVFRPGSPITEPAVREILLQNVAGPDHLRLVVDDESRPKHERDVALFTLLHKDLSHERFEDFLKDRKKIPADARGDGSFFRLQLSGDISVGIFGAQARKGDFDCPSLSTTVTTLAREAQNASARLCLGDFWLANGFDYFTFDSGFGGWGEPLESEFPVLGSSPSLFPGKAVPRQQYYQRIISDPQARAGEKAYALYRAVRCYATSGNNSCGGETVPLNVRKGWFRQLKRRYPSSKWAKQLKYYW